MEDREGYEELAESTQEAREKLSSVPVEHRQAHEALVDGKGTTPEPGTDGRPEGDPFDEDRQPPPVAEAKARPDDSLLSTRIKVQGGAFDPSIMHTLVRSILESIFDLHHRGLTLNGGWTARNVRVRPCGSCAFVNVTPVHLSAPLDLSSTATETGVPQADAVCRGATHPHVVADMCKVAQVVHAALTGLSLQLPFAGSPQPTDVLSQQLRETLPRVAELLNSLLSGHATSAIAAMQSLAPLDFCSASTLETLSFAAFCDVLTANRTMDEQRHGDGDGHEPEHIQTTCHLDRLLASLNTTDRLAVPTIIGQNFPATPATGHDGLVDAASSTILLTLRLPLVAPKDHATSDLPATRQVSLTGEDLIAAAPLLYLSALASPQVSSCYDNRNTRSRRRQSRVSERARRLLDRSQSTEPVERVNQKLLS